MTEQEKRIMAGLIKRVDFLLAVNIEVTGLPKWKSSLGCYASRCRIEFVGDGEPSTFTGATIQSN